MLPVAHQLPDVVQQRRRLQQRALRRRRSRAPWRAGRRAGARGGARARRAGGPHWQRSANSRKSRSGSGTQGLLRARHLQQQTFPQPERTHRQTPRAHLVEQLGGHGQAGQDDVGALGVEAGHLSALLDGPAGEPLEQLLDLRRRDARAVHRIAGRQPAAGLHHATQAGEGAARADDDGPRPLARGEPALEPASDRVPENGDLLVGRSFPRQIELGEAHGTEGKREGELHQPIHRPDQLETAAADVGDQGALTRQGEMVRHRAVGQRRFGVGVDDAERDVQLLPHAPDEPRAVLRLPHGRRGHGGDAAHAAALAHLAHPGESLDRALHRGVVETAGAGEPRRQPGLVLQLVDDGEAGGGVVFRDEQADRVRADVDGRDALAGLGAATEETGWAITPRWWPAPRRGPRRGA